jgi:hypothetical protein
VVDADHYEPIGKLMDGIARSVSKEVGLATKDGAIARAHFDFTGIQTRPCKQARMTALAQEMPFPEREYVGDGL